MKTWQTEKLALRNDLAKAGTCKKCGAPVLRALAGRVAALEVVADAEPISAKAEAAVLDDSLMTWCLTSPKPFPSRILWRTRWHRKSCEHSIVRDHRCPQDQCRILTLRDAVLNHDKGRTT